MHKQSSLNHRRDEEVQIPADADLYSPKPQKPKSWSRSMNYLFKEQRLLFVLVGMLIASTIFMLQPNLASHDLRRKMATSGKFRNILNENAVQNSRTSVRTVTAPKILMGLKRQRLRIVVTGGAGFVGSHLVDRLLERGDSVIVIDNFFTGRKENVMHHFSNPRFELIRHDVVEPILLEVDQIYHLACPASPVHYKYNPVKTIVRIARIFNTYGPRMGIDDGRVVSNFVAQALRKEPLTVYGDGKQTRSFQYVSDLVEGLIRLMESNHIGPFNLGNPGEFTMLELAEVVKETVDPNARIEFKENTADDPHKRKPDITKAKDLLNWEPIVSLREGLPRMVEDFRKRVFDDQKDGERSKVN